MAAHHNWSAPACCATIARPSLATGAATCSSPIWARPIIRRSNSSTPSASRSAAASLAACCANHKSGAGCSGESLTLGVRALVGRVGAVAVARSEGGLAHRSRRSRRRALILRPVVDACRSRGCVIGSRWDKADVPVLVRE